MNIQVKIEKDAIDYKSLYHAQYKMVRERFKIAAQNHEKKDVCRFLISTIAENEVELEPDPEPIIEAGPIAPIGSTLLWLNEELKIPRCSAVGIVDYVCHKYGVSKIDLVSVRRTMDLILPRQEIMFKLRHHTVLSLPQIGRLLGDRDHTTVLHGIRKFQIRLDNNDPKLIPDPAHWIDGLQMHRVFVGQGDGI